MGSRLSEKVALITGGGAGIGAATAQRFAEEGATVIICGRTEASLQETCTTIETHGGQAAYFRKNTHH